MENLKVRCKLCNKELESNLKKTMSCGCSNMTTITDNKITAVDLSKVIMLNNISNKKNSNVLKQEDLMWQEERRKRKVKRLEFEIR